MLPSKVRGVWRYHRCRSRPCWRETQRCRATARSALATATWSSRRHGGSCREACGARARYCTHFSLCLYSFESAACFVHATRARLFLRKRPAACVAGERRARAVRGGQRAPRPRQARRGTRCRNKRPTVVGSSARSELSGHQGSLSMFPPSTGPCLCPPTSTVSLIHTLRAREQCWRPRASLRRWSSCEKT